jgi:hypothetical protein
VIYVIAACGLAGMAYRLIMWPLYWAKFQLTCFLVIWLRAQIWLIQ